MGGLISAVMVELADGDDQFGTQFNSYFFETRTPREQAGYQLAGLGLTLGIGIVSGVLGGFIASRQFFEPPKELFDDTEHWHDNEILEEYMGDIDKKVARVYPDDPDEK